VGLKDLAETIILQSLEDLFTVDSAKESIRFFEGEGFRLAAEIAGLGFEEKQEIMHIFMRISSRYSPSKTHPSRNRIAAEAAI